MYGRKAFGDEDITIFDVKLAYTIGVIQVLFIVFLMAGMMAFPVNN